MKKFGFLLSVLILSACGADVCEQANFQTKHNICVYTNGYDVSKEQVEIATELTIVEVSSRYPKKYAYSKIENFENTSISFVEDAGPNRDGSMTWRKDLNGATFKIESEYSSFCLWRWEIVVHELLHVLLKSEEGANGHRPGWHVMKEFSTEENNSSIQRIVSRRVYEQLCL